MRLIYLQTPKELLIPACDAHVIYNAHRALDAMMYTETLLHHAARYSIFQPEYFLSYLRKQSKT